MNKKLLHTPEGVRDIYGREYAGKLWVENKIHQIIKSYGYEDIQTPSFELFDVFSKEIGTTPSKELYKFFDKENNTLVLRPDFTPSIARCAAKYFMEEQVPIRFSYLGNTFNNTSNLQGKLKEVTQMGAELINEPSVEADAEIISLVIEALLGVGLKQFQVSIGEMEFFKGLCEEAGLDEETELDLRACISGKNYFAAQEILSQGRGQVDEPWVSLLSKAVDMLVNMNSFADVGEHVGNKGSLGAIERLLESTDMLCHVNSLSEARSLVKNERSLGAIDRLEKLEKVLKAYGVEKYISFDLSMLSKYNYYTGVIFKAYTYGVGNAIVKGGRYDSLLHQFGKEAPAIGFALVIDDILGALSRQKVEIPVTCDIQTLHYRKGDSADYLEKLAQARQLRENGTPVALTPEE